MHISIRCTAYFMSVVKKLHKNVFLYLQNLKEIAGKVFVDVEPEICPPEVRRTEIF